LPVRIDSPDEQNMRRTEALSDLYNFVSLSALWSAIIGNENVLDMFKNEKQDLIIDQDLIFNTDCTSILIGEKDSKAAYLAEGSREKLREKNMSTGITKEPNLPDQERSVQLVVTTNAAGNLIHTAVKFKDNTVKSKKIFEVKIPFF